MVQVKMLTFDGDRVRYSYQPERKGAEGIIAYIFSENKLEVENMAENDFEGVFYTQPIYGMITKAGKNNLPKEKVLSWY